LWGQDSEGKEWRRVEKRGKYSIVIAFKVVGKKRIIVLNLSQPNQMQCKKNTGEERRNNYREESDSPHNHEEGDKTKGGRRCWGEEKNLLS